MSCAPSHIPSRTPSDALVSAPPVAPPSRRQAALRRRAPPSAAPRTGRWLALATLAALVLAASSAPAWAAESARSDEGVRLSLSRYQELMRRASGQASDAAWGRATVDVKVPAGADATHATVEIIAHVKPSGAGPAHVLLLPGDQLIESVTVDGQRAHLLRRSGAHMLRLTEVDEAVTVRLVVQAPVREDAHGRSVLLTLPPVLGATLKVSGVSDARVWPSASALGGGRYQLPATTAVLVGWGHGAAQGAVRSVRYAVRPEAQGDGVDVTAVFSVQVSRAPVSLRLVDAKSALTAVRDGKRALVSGVAQGWHTVTVRGPGEHTVTATFRLAVDRTHGQPQIRLPLGRVPITQVVAVVQGERSVHFDPPVPLRLSVTGSGDKATTQAVGHLPPTDAVTIRWTESRAAPEQVVRMNTETWQLVRLEEGVLRSRVVLGYEVIRGELNTLSVQIPDDVVVYKVEGAGVEDWRTFAAQKGKPRQVQISLAGGATGKRTLTLQLERVAPRKAGTPISVPVVRPLHAFREMGAVALFDGRKVGFAPIATPKGFTPAGQDALPSDVRKTLRDKVSQVFKHVGGPGQLATKVAAARAHDVRFDARVTTLFDVEERSLRGTSAVLITLKSGRIDHLVISLPSAANEPKVNAPSLNKVQPAKDFDAGKGRRAWEVRFTQALEGAVQLQVDFDMVLPKKLGNIRIPDVRVHKAEVEEGVVALTAEASIELKPDPSKDLRPVPVADLPRALKRESQRELRYGFRYTHAPWTLNMAVQRHRTVQTLDAMVSAAWLTTHVLDSGHLSTRALYQIRNTDRQFARLELPKGARVLSVVAGGKRIKPVQDDAGALAIPLPKGKALLVELRYELKVGPLGLFGRVDLVAPKVDLRQGALRWTLKTPASHGLFGVTTNLKDGPGRSWKTAPAVPNTGLTVEMPEPEDAVQRRFTYAVHEPNEPALQVSFSHSSVPESAVESLLFFLALVALALATFRALSQRRLDRKLTLLLVVGVGALAAEALVWGVAFGEVAVIALVCAGVAGAWGVRRLIRLSRGVEVG